MQLQKQLFGEPDKKVFDIEKIVEKFALEIGHAVFDSRHKVWLIAVDEKLARGKGSKMGLTEDLSVDDTGVNDWILQGMLIEGNLAQFVGMDLSNNSAIEIVNTKGDRLTIRGFGLMHSGEKRVVFFNNETEKWEVEI